MQIFHLTAVLGLACAASARLVQNFGRCYPGTVTSQGRTSGWCYLNGLTDPDNRLPCYIASPPSIRLTAFTNGTPSQNKECPSAAHRCQLSDDNHADCNIS
ncbi:hypothetical protein WAI453_012551 [Rhynchosporium graminicola]